MSFTLRCSQKDTSAQKSACVMFVLDFKSNAKMGLHMFYHMCLPPYMLPMRQHRRKNRTHKAVAP